MTAKVLPLQQLQTGRQTVFATAVTPTAKLSILEEAPTIVPDIGIEAYKRLGSIAPAHDHQILAVRGSANVPGVATYEDLPYFLNSLFTEVTTPSGASPFVYTYVGPLTAIPTRRISTLVYGDSAEAYALVGGLLDVFSLSIESEGDWRMTSDWVGGFVEADLAEALSDRTATPIRAADTIIYLDAFGGTVGTTAITCEAFSVELEINTGTILIPALGSLQPCDETQTTYEATLTLTMEFPGTSKTLVENMLGITPTLTKQLIRIEGTSGTNIAEIDFAGSFIDSPEFFTDRDGVLTVEMNFEAEVDAGTFANWIKAEVTNDVTTLP